MTAFPAPLFPGQRLHDWWLRHKRRKPRGIVDARGGDPNEVYSANAAVTNCCCGGGGPAVNCTSCQSGTNHLSCTLSGCGFLNGTYCMVNLPPPSNPCVWDFSGTISGHLFGVSFGLLISGIFQLQVVWAGLNEFIGDWTPVAGFCSGISSSFTIGNGYSGGSCSLSATATITKGC
jgi:hypothetical protein